MMVSLTQSVSVDIHVKDGSDAITRITGEEGDEWRRHLYKLYTEEDVLEMWADSAIRNGVEDANKLDGWADLEDGEVTMSITDSQIESYSKYADRL